MDKRVGGVVLILIGTASSANCAKECGEEGDFCGKNYKDSNDTEVKACGVGFYCDNQASICRKKIADQEPCKFRDSCLNPNSQCVQAQRKICLTAHYRGIGESCNGTAQCTQPLLCTKHVCTKRSQDHCISNNECKGEDYCSLGGVCLPLPDRGEDCELQIGCAHGYICGMKDPKSFYGKCIPLHSKQDQSYCNSDNECDISEGLYCKTNLCSKYYPSDETKDCLIFGCDLSIEQCVCSYSNVKREIIIMSQPPEPTPSLNVTQRFNQTRGPRPTRPRAFNGVNPEQNDIGSEDNVKPELREGYNNMATNGYKTPQPSSNSTNQCKPKFVFSKECKDLAIRASLCKWESHCPRVDNENLESCITRRCGLYNSCYKFKCVLHSNCYPYNGACEILDKLMASQQHKSGSSRQLSNFSFSLLSIAIVSILLFIL
ncbi:hypothetical protein PPL_11746 [Heterostelium album PN500]|uniref:Uncharacterized protein n=1 Tax=Heterostelium pallidum (strain ATCC 26659 / Pp 5 / PN500) TaxID=670386 RepID=D3BUC7_HETP5|nr:hypothetical protein PPL_11746 [Heterostelium album PN500]EFA74715.1 hypothetical protein PPL_11746 [Heterostelium album PN500]|eukprot:XP_020426849.1 hypothetical protein PPL_11746 [Heterostelium album PN500]